MVCPFLDDATQSHPNGESSDRVNNWREHHSACEVGRWEYADAGLVQTCSDSALDLQGMLVLDEIASRSCGSGVEVVCNGS